MSGMKKPSYAPLEVGGSPSKQDRRAGATSSFHRLRRRRQCAYVVVALVGLLAAKKIMFSGKYLLL